MDNEWLTISQFSKIVKKSRQTIYNRLDKDLTGYWTEVDSTKYINRAALSLFMSKEPVKLDSQLDNEFDKMDSKFDRLDSNLTAYLTAIDTLKAELEKVHAEFSTLQANSSAQLAAKDEHIKELEAGHKAEIKELKEEHKEEVRELKAEYKAQLAEKANLIKDLTTSLMREQELNARQQQLTATEQGQLTDQNKGAASSSSTDKASDFVQVKEAPAAQTGESQSNEEEGSGEDQSGNQTTETESKGSSADDLEEEKPKRGIFGGIIDKLFKRK